jgi:hypothetical protein
MIDLLSCRRRLRRDRLVPSGAGRDGLPPWPDRLGRHADRERAGDPVAGAVEGDEAALAGSPSTTATFVDSSLPLSLLDSSKPHVLASLKQSEEQPGDRLTP